MYVNPQKFLNDLVEAIIDLHTYSHLGNLLILCET